LTWIKNRTGKAGTRVLEEASALFNRKHDALKDRETTMRKSILLSVTIAASAAMLLAATDTTLAQKKAKKLTYEQAWAECRKDVQANLPGDTTQSAARYTRGAGCMKQHGYRLKKSSMKSL
jgi:hypothetical protein